MITTTDLIEAATLDTSHYMHDLDTFRLVADAARDKALRAAAAWIERWAHDGGAFRSELISAGIEKPKEDER